MNNIQESIIKLFPLKKIRDSLNEWFGLNKIKYNQPFAIDGKYIDKTKSIIIDESDSLSILEITMDIKFYMGTYYYVKVAVGMLKTDIHNNPIIDKCIIIFSYNSDSELSLYSADFYHVDYE